MGRIQDTDVANAGLAHGVAKNIDTTLHDINTMLMPSNSHAPYQQLLKDIRPKLAATTAFHLDAAMPFVSTTPSIRFSAQCSANRNDTERTSTDLKPNPIEAILRH